MSPLFMTYTVGSLKKGTEVVDYVGHVYGLSQNEVSERAVQKLGSKNFVIVPKRAVERRDFLPSRTRILRKLFICKWNSKESA